MFKHLFKLIWNKKKQNSLLITEMLISFLVMFAVFTFMVNSYSNYSAPMGFSYKNVWVINYNNTLTTGNNDSITQYYQALKQNLKSLPQIRNVSWVSSNIPFSTNTMSTSMMYNKNRIEHVNNFMVDDDYVKTLHVKMLEGRWYDKRDNASKTKLVIVNKAFAEKAFGKGGSAVGKLLGDNDDKNKTKIIGVVENLKFRGDYQESEVSMYSRIDTGSYRWMGQILVEVTPDADAAFESRLYKFMANNLKDSHIEIEHLENKLSSINKFTLVPLIILSIVAAFLIINVALGLFGVLWYNINKRRGEIGLRRAIGATGNAVSKQLVTESLIVATFSLIIGTFFAVQFPLLNVFDLPMGVYLVALALSISFIYLLVLICSLYPGKQAAAIYPAVALHEE